MLRFQLKQITMVKINKTYDSSCWQGFEEIENLLISSESQTYTVPFEISVIVPQEAWNRSASGSSYSTLGHVPNGYYSLLQRHLLIHVLLCYS